MFYKEKSSLFLVLAIYTAIFSICSCKNIGVKPPNKKYTINVEPAELYVGQEITLSLQDASSQQAIADLDVVFQLTTSSSDTTFETTKYFTPQHPGKYTITAYIDSKPVASIPIMVNNNSAPDKEEATVEGEPTYSPRGAPEAQEETPKAAAVDAAKSGSSLGATAQEEEAAVKIQRAWKKYQARKKDQELAALKASEGESPSGTPEAQEETPKELIVSSSGDGTHDSGNRSDQGSKAAAVDAAKSGIVELNTKEDITSLKEKLDKVVSERRANNRVEALKNYKIRFKNPNITNRPIAEELKQLEKDLPRNLTIKIGEENITQEIKKAKGSITERKLDTLVDKAVKKIQEKIPDDLQALILPWLHQGGVWAAITAKLFTLTIGDPPTPDLFRIGDPHLQMQRVINISEDFTTITGRFTLCTEAVQDNDSGEQTLIEVTFTVLPESGEVTCSFGTSLTNISSKRGKIPSVNNERPSWNFWNQPGRNK